MIKLDKNCMPTEVRFPAFGDAYMVMQEFYFLGNSQDYVSYANLLEIINRLNLKYKVYINYEWVTPDVLVIPELEKYGWTKAGDIKIDKPMGCMSDPLADMNVIYFPEVEKLKED